MPDVLDYQSKRKKKRDRRYVWRAAGYLRPYKRLVVVSIVCAFFAGGVFFSGLGAILPVLQTLLNGDTPQMWVDRMVAEQRWGVDIEDDPGAVRTSIPFGMANGWGAGASMGDVADLLEQTSPETLRLLATAEPAALDRAIQDTGGTVVVSVPDGGSDVVPQRWNYVEQPTQWHLRLLRRLVYLLPSGPVGAVAVIMLGVFLLSALANGVRFVQEFLSNKAALSAVNDIRRELYDHALRAPLAYFGKTGTGDVTSRIVHDCGQLQEGFRTMLGRAVQEPIFALFAFAFALWVDWRLTLFVVAMAPVMLVILKKFGTKMRRAGRATLGENAELLGQIEGTLSGVRVVKANNAEAAEVGRIKGVLDRLLGHSLKLAKYDAMSTPVMETFAVLAIGVIFTVATYLVRVDGTLSAAGALMIFAALVQIAESLRRLSKLNVVLQKANAAGERIFEAIDLPMEDSPRRHGDTEERKGGNLTSAAVSVPPCLRGDFSEVAFEGVTFAYSPEQPPALDDVSLTVKAGESVAVVGRNGSGKTTLLSLLPRFYEPDAGRVTIDGRDVREMALHDLRRLIGVVTQDAHVFPGTVAHNLAYGRPDATRDEIVAAAKQAEAHDFILAKPDGYDTVLTGLGGGLSGGQRQRLNIARAILRDPPILILDEATSQVDAESEHLIQNAISRLMKGRTTFVIAHRFSTILDCDRIALMERGRLEAVGTHDELLSTSDVYRNLYERQLVAAA